MVKRILVVLLAVPLFGCATTPPQLSLTSAEATRIADAKAKSTGHDPRLYLHAMATYDTTDKSWWVNYRRKTAKFTHFSVRVEDKTKQAWFVTSERH
jgi:hypothetical protein